MPSSMIMEDTTSGLGSRWALAERSVGDPNPKDAPHYPLIEPLEARMVATLRAAMAAAATLGSNGYEIDESVRLASTSNLFSPRSKLRSPNAPTGLDAMDGGPEVAEAAMACGECLVESGWVDGWMILVDAWLGRAGGWVGESGNAFR
jgi:hypothetical protein